MHVYLKTDFTDFYDHQFDSQGACFERMSVTSMSRADALGKLELLGLATPQWASVKALRSNLYLPGSTQVVVYLDEYSHRGMGKKRMMLGEAMVQYPGKLASLFVPSSFRNSVSFRYLRIGTKRFWLVYDSDDDWRSNCGSNVEIELANPPLYLANFHDQEHIPMLAIDFVKCCYGGYLAIDYNTSPGLRGTPIEGEMTPTQIVDEIREIMRTKLL